MLITIFKSFIRPRLDYGDIIYDQAYNTLFHEDVESVQYNAALAIMGAVWGTSIEKLYQENIPQLHRKPDFLKNSFLPSTIKGWNNLDPHIGISKSISIFKGNILKFIQPKPNNFYYYHNPNQTINKVTSGLEPPLQTQV